MKKIHFRPHASNSIQLQYRPVTVCAYAVAVVPEHAADGRSHSTRNMILAVEFFLGSSWFWWPLDSCKCALAAVLALKWHWVNGKIASIHTAVCTIWFNFRFCSSQFQCHYCIRDQLSTATRCGKCNHHGTIWRVRHTGISTYNITAIEPHFGEKLRRVDRSLGIDAERYVSSAASRWVPPAKRLYLNMFPA